MTYDNIEEYHFWNWVAQYPHDGGLFAIISDCRLARLVRRRRRNRRGLGYHPKDWS